MKKAAQLREQTNEELLALKSENEREIFALRNALTSSDKEAKPHERIEKRRENARIETILGERKRAHAKQ